MAETDPDALDKAYARRVERLTELTVGEMVTAKHQEDHQRDALKRYYRRGYAAGLTTEELIDFLGVSTLNILELSGYNEEEAQAAMQVSNGLTDEEIDRAVLPEKTQPNSTRT
jgi:hypothetical protein